MGKLNFINTACLLWALLISTPATATNNALHHTESIILKQQTGFTIDRQFVGSVFAKQNANIGFELAGKIADLVANTGERVTKGSVLASLDTELLQIERDELYAQLAQTDADIVLVKANLNRLNSLQKKGYTSDQSVDELKAKQKSLFANKARINASLAANQTRIEKSQLIAPFDAQVGQRLVSQGQVVSAGSPVFELLQLSDQEVRIGLPVRLIDKLDHSLNQHTHATIAGQTVPVSLITKGASVDPATRTVQLRFAIDDNFSFIPGQLAYLNLVEQQPQSGFWVPLSALTDGLRGTWNVFVLVQQEEQAWQIERRDVRVAHANQDAAFIYGAIQDQERIIATGLHKFVPGQHVTTQTSQWSTKHD
ncbi:efflux RND transporter periplasmic adaptor subunit [Motilimonas eburnea]|uniref:efflux RND transporter periplasmic adaptor subunit n=1 Tax=Motilimonas eburnea TaxID=1737488 RepID=UPI001E552F10|nr:efflux RND transporter periplasmic adaptor subunit [Motilimonas eburnea]MCE2573558.1 efflux RND transporter periplasmic adaptor subunit [Motilimonas eburnea]